MGDHSLGCRTTSDRIARHNMIRDVLFETAASADLGPSREEKHLLPGTIARPGDVTIRRWANGKDVAIDVTVTGPLCPSNVADAAREPGASLSKACQRKTRETAEACRLQGLVFLPFAMETLGGLHSGAVGQVKQLAACLARCKGLQEGEVTGQIFGKLSLTLLLPFKDALATVWKRQFCSDNINPGEVSFKFHKEVLSTSTTPLLAPWNGFSGSLT